MFSLFSYGLLPFRLEIEIVQQLLQAVRQCTVGHFRGEGNGNKLCAHDRAPPYRSSQRSVGSLANNMQNFPTVFSIAGQSVTAITGSCYRRIFFYQPQTVHCLYRQPVGALIVQDLIRIYKGLRLFQAKISLYNESYIFYN